MRAIIERAFAARVCGVVLSGFAIAGCSSLPNWAEVRTPQLDAYIPTDANQYRTPVSFAARPVAAADLVDAQGLCAGMASPSSDATSSSSSATASRLSSKGIGLGVTECEVVATIGQPQSVNADSSAGDRTVTMTYTSGERPGVYRFVSGRLTSMERGAEAYASAPAPAAKKTTAKKSARAAN